MVIMKFYERYPALFVLSGDGINTVYGSNFSNNKGNV